MYAPPPLVVRTHILPASHVNEDVEVPPPTQVTLVQAVAWTDQVPVVQVACVRPAPAQSS
jgi:hypothetical protein